MAGMREEKRRPTASCGFTRSGEPLADGLNQKAYDEMMHSWHGGRSQAEIEIAERRAKDAMLSAFPTARSHMRLEKQIIGAKNMQTIEKEFLSTKRCSEIVQR
jgi:hypothetical protein